MLNYEIVNLENEGLIKLVRRYKQLSNAANTNAANGDMEKFSFWTRKADIKMHEFMKAMGLPRGTTVITLQGTTKQVAILH